MSKNHSKATPATKTKVRLNRQTKKQYAVIFGMIFAVAGALALLFTQAASIGTLSLSPSTTQLSLNQTVTVYVIEDSKTEKINAVQADIVYDPKKLQLKSADGNLADGTGAFNLQARKDTATPGKINLAYATTRPDATNQEPMINQQRVATLVFQAIGSGSTSISFANTSLLMSSTTNENILSTTSGVTLNIKDTEAPKPPTGLTSPSQTVNSVALAWTAPADNVGVTGYVIYRNDVQVGTSATPSYSDTGLSAGTSYRYAIAARDAAGNTSARSAQATVATRADTVAPTTPTGLAMTSNTNDSISLKWNAATDNVGVTGYRIMQGTAVKTTNGTSFTWNGLAMGRSYTFMVAAYDARGNVSAPASVTLSTVKDTAAPTVPTNVKAERINSKKAKISWAAATDNVGVTKYNVYRSGVSTPFTTTGTSFDDTGLTLGTVYSYTVRAVDATGNVSPPSTAVQVKIDYRPGDVNDDGAVDMLDFSIIAGNWDKKQATRAMGDLNKNGTVDLFDLSIMAGNFDL